MKLLIAGYYGFGNLGDELILSSILRDLREHSHITSITVLSHTPRQTRQLHGVRAVPRWGPVALLREIWRSDILVVGGGGLLQNQTSHTSLLYYLGIVAAARLFRLPILFYALGIETIRGRFWKPIVKFLFNHKSVHITVRDENSRDWLTSAGLSHTDVHITADPVFSMSSTLPPPPRYSKGENRTALLIPRYPSPPGGQTLFQKIGFILRREMNMKVRWMLFHPNYENRFIGTFLEDIICPTRETFSSENKLKEFSESISRFDCVISSRFHGLVLAACARRPFIGVGDPEKVGRLCRRWGMPFLHWNATEADIRMALKAISSVPPEALEAPLIRAKEAASITSSFVSVEAIGPS